MIFILEKLIAYDSILSSRSPREITLVQWQILESDNCVMKKRKQNLGLKKKERETENEIRIIPMGYKIYAQKGKLAAWLESVC